MSVRVLLADDERLIRAGFRMILSAEPGIQVVGEAADGHEAIAAACSAASWLMRKASSTWRRLWTR